jgi:hypothetical protein
MPVQVALRAPPGGQFVTRWDRRAPRSWPCQAASTVPQVPCRSQPIPSHRNAPRPRPPCRKYCSLRIRANDGQTGRAAGAGAGGATRGPRPDRGSARARRGRLLVLPYKRIKLRKKKKTSVARGQLGRVQRVTAAHGSRPAASLRLPPLASLLGGPDFLSQPRALHAMQASTASAAPLGVLFPAFPFPFIASLAVGRSKNRGMPLSLAGGVLSGSPQLPFAETHRGHGTARQADISHVLPLLFCQFFF